MADLSCGASCLKYIMFLVNFIFWITGGVILGVGIWLAVDDKALDFLDGIADGPMDDPMFAAAIYTLIAVGAFIFLLGFLGCCGACTHNSCMMCLYVILVSIVLVGELVAGILLIVFWGDIDEQINEQMRASLTDDYGKTDNEGGYLATTLSWDSMQQDFDCCGVDNHTNYKNSFWWNSTGDDVYVSNKVTYVALVVDIGKAKVPLSCCKSYDKDSDDQTLPVCQAEARDDEKDTEELHTKGCRDGLNDWFDDNAVIFIAVTFSFLGLQLFGLIFACVLRSSFGKDGEVV